MFSGVFGNLIDWLKIWAFRLLIICFIFGIGAATMHTMLTHAIDTITTILTGHSGIHLPSVKK